VRFRCFAKNALTYPNLKQTADGIASARGAPGGNLAAHHNQQLRKKGFIEK
jgi:hypothetical protein